MAIEEVRNIDDIPLDEFKSTLGNATKQDLKNILKNVQKDKEEMNSYNYERTQEEKDRYREIMNKPFERVR